LILRNYEVALRTSKELKRLLTCPVVLDLQIRLKTFGQTSRADFHKYLVHQPQSNEPINDRCGMLRG
jgi:hypothetical protein